MEKNYNQNPEKIDDGDKLPNRIWEYCSKCFGQIYCPILDGIWYHSDQRYYDGHSPKPANTITQLFLMYKHADNGIMLKIGKYDDEEMLACPCFLSWYKLARSSNIVGFQEEHYYDKNGITLCKVYTMDLTPYDITECNYPEKQGELCEDCLTILIKRKMIKITPSEKQKRKYANRIEWLSVSQKSKSKK